MRTRKIISEGLFAVGLVIGAIGLYMVQATNSLHNGALWLVFAVGLMCASLIYLFATDDPESFRAMTGGRVEREIDLREPTASKAATPARRRATRVDA